MDLDKGIVMALVLGASATSTGPGAAALLSRYAELKQLLQVRYPGLNLALVETAPNSNARRVVLEEDLRGTAAGQDPDVQRLAFAVLAESLGRAADHPSTVGVDLEHIKAASLAISSIITLPKVPEI